MQKHQYKIMYEVEDTHFWYVGMRAIVVAILRAIILPPRSKILDAGCGTGANLKFLTHYGEVTGLDISSLALRFCATRGSNNLKQGSIDKLPFRSNTFNLITCFDVLGHEQVCQTDAISEFYRVLKPGGTLLIRVAAYSWLYSRHDYVVQNVRRYSKSSLHHLMIAAGFSPTRYTYANMFLFPLIVSWRIISSVITPTDLDNSDTRKIPTILNTILTLPLKLEAIVLNYFNLPFGLSFIVVARKPNVRRAKLKL